MGFDLGYVRALAEEAEGRDGWAPFADYYRLRGEGLRSEALIVLDGFIAQAVAWPLADRVALSVWIGERLAGYRGQPEAVLPVPLFRLLVRPSLEAWAQASPLDPLPLVWLARLSSGGATLHAAPGPLLREALVRDPEFEPARLDFVHELLRGVAYNQHELPDAYLGDAGEDVVDLAEGEALLDGLGLDEQADLRPRVVSARRAAERWLRDAGGSSTD